MTTATLDPPVIVEPQTRQRKVLTAREVHVTKDDGYAGLTNVIPLFAELLATYDGHDEQGSLQGNLEWVVGVACSPWARLWAFYDGETMVGLLLVEIQEVYGTLRLFVYGYYLRKGYVVGKAGQEVEARLEEWGREQGARYVEFQTPRSPKSFLTRGYHIQFYVMRKSLEEGI